VACVLFLVAALSTETLSFYLPIRAWGSLAYLGVFSSFLCLTLQTTAQKYTPSSHVSIFLSAEALFAAVLGVMMLHEILTARIFFGGALIMGAILLVELNNTQRPNEKQYIDVKE